jgi:hypothetical protein
MTSNQKQLAFLPGRELSFLGHCFVMVAELLLSGIKLFVSIFILFISTHATTFGLFDREQLDQEYQQTLEMNYIL